ncbi:recombinase family protein [Streptomyces parvulus]|uniref:recombinase family protein n=1 Tax=Streptomyces parvulus TaxID=146923 RepID=UPI00210942A2|nr:recombinase family protein [Streptomyces parvulus]MCQ4193853.1 recombinase family protein [Streptomyces parvulus]
MTTKAATRTAREYLRVSKGKGRTARSITDQHRDNLAAEGDHGPWSWGEAYRDTGSASKYATKTRDDFERLLSDLGTGAFGPAGDVLVLWEVSRLARETGRGVALVDAAEAGGYLIHVTSLDRTFNPRNYGDRHSLISGINDAEKEARLLSARTLRGVTSAAGDGRPHGKIPFGFRRTYELIDGRPRPVSQEADPAEGPLVVELFERVAGWEDRPRESVRAVALDWEKRGIRSRDGVVFSRQNLVQVLKRKAYVGIRVHKGEERPGNWKPLVEPALFDAVQRILADPSRKTHTGSQVKHVLTGVIKCDTCGGKVSLRPGGRSYDGRMVYRCWEKDCFTIDKEQTDGHLLNLLMTYLFLAPRDEVPAALADEEEANELAAVRAGLVSKRSQLEAFEAEDPETPAEARLIGRKIAKLEGEIKELERRAAGLTEPDPLSDVFETGPGAADRWVAADITVQRTVAALVFSPQGALGQPRVRRVADSVSPAVSDRIRMVRATEEAQA